jgi:hypothetical protein
MGINLALCLSSGDDHPLPRRRAAWSKMKEHGNYRIILGRQRHFSGHQQ